MITTTTAATTTKAPKGFHSVNKFIDFFFLLSSELSFKNNFLNIQLAIWFLIQVNNFSNIVTDLLNHLKLCKQFIEFSEKKYHKNSLENFFFVSRAATKDFSVGKFLQVCSEHGEKKKQFSVSQFWRRALYGRNNKNTNIPRAFILRTHCAAKTCNFEGSYTATRNAFSLLFILRLLSQLRHLKLHRKISDRSFGRKSFF